MEPLAPGRRLPWQHNQGLEIICLLPRWSDVLYYMEQDPQVLFVIVDTQSSKLRWLYYRGTARRIEDPVWSQILSNADRLEGLLSIHPGDEYAAIHIKPLREDLIDECNGWVPRNVGILKEWPMCWVRKAAAKQEQVETMPPYTIQHSVENGIERIRYLPARRRRLPPILMVHGMWHGAWCWQPWQELLAAWGWESHAFSLPGHGMSPAQRPVYFCTLDYYLGFLKAEVARWAQTGLIGHSMGGALVQWYLRYFGDDLPAAVLAAPWACAVRSAMAGQRRFDSRPAPAASRLAHRLGQPFIRSPRLAAAISFARAPCFRRRYSYPTRP